MTPKEQIKILDDEISTCASGDLSKYEYLTKQDLEYKPDAFEQAKFEYSPLRKVLTDGLTKEDKSKKIGLFKRLKNIEDNLVEVDDDDNKVGIFRIIKDIKDKGIKIDNNDEAVREIRECIKELIDDGAKVNNFDEMKEEIIDHIQNLKEQGINVKVDEDQINDLIKRISDKKDKVDKEDKEDKSLRSYLKGVLTNNKHDLSITYDENKINTEKINSILKKYSKGRYEFPKFINEYNNYMERAEKFESFIEKRKREKPGTIIPNQKDMINYFKKIKDIVQDFNNTGSGINKTGKGLKILTNQQILSRLPILLAQIQAGYNSIKLKNETRQILYSLYRSKALTKTVYNKLIKSI